MPCVTFINYCHWYATAELTSYTAFSDAFDFEIITTVMSQLVTEKSRLNVKVEHFPALLSLCLLWIKTDINMVTLNLPHKPLIRYWRHWSFKWTGTILFSFSKSHMTDCASKYWRLIVGGRVKSLFESASAKLLRCVIKQSVKFIATGLLLILIYENRNMVWNRFLPTQSASPLNRLYWHWQAKVHFSMAAMFAQLMIQPFVLTINITILKLKAFMVFLLFSTSRDTHL